MRVSDVPAVLAELGRCEEPLPDRLLRRLLWASLLVGTAVGAIVGDLSTIRRWVESWDSATVALLAAVLAAVVAWKDQFNDVAGEIFQLLVKIVGLVVPMVVVGATLVAAGLQAADSKQSLQTGDRVLLAGDFIIVLSVVMLVLFKFDGKGADPGDVSAS